MKVVKKILPVFFALIFVFGGSYYLFTNYKPKFITQVKGAKSQKNRTLYLDTIPLPTDSSEVGRNVRDSFSQLTASSRKSAQEIQRFFRSVLVAKGWKVKAEGDELLSVVYTRDGEKLEVSVLSFDDKQGTVFSLSHSH